MSSKQYNQYMNERMQRTPEGKKSYDKIVAQKKAVKGFPKKVAKAVVKKVSDGFNTFQTKVTKKMKAKMGFKK